MIVDVLVVMFLVSGTLMFSVFAYLGIRSMWPTQRVGGDQSMDAGIPIYVIEQGHQHSPSGKRPPLN